MPIPQFQPTIDVQVRDFIVGSASVQRSDAVYVDTSTGKIIIADADIPFQAVNVQGIVERGNTLNNTASVRIGGILNDAFTGFIPGKMVYLKSGGISGDTLTQTPPTLDGRIQLPVGFALSQTDLNLGIMYPIEL